MDKYRNANGTYDGPAFFSDMTGIPKAEVLWMANRMNELLRKGKSKADAKRIVAEEAKGQPWTA